MVDKVESTRNLRKPSPESELKKKPKVNSHTAPPDITTLSVPLPLLRTQAWPRIHNRGYRKLCCYYNFVRESIGGLVIDNFLFEFTSGMNYNKPRGKSSVYYLRSVKNISLEHGF